MIHEVPPDLVGSVRETSWVLVVRRREQNHRRIHGAGADTEEPGRIGNGLALRGRRRVIPAELWTPP